MDGPIKRRGTRKADAYRGGEGGDTKCQHKHKLISDAINVNKRSRLISQYICVCVCVSFLICIVSFMCEWQREAADTNTRARAACAQVGGRERRRGGGQASKAIKINNFQYFALMEKQRKITRASRVFSNEASDVTRPRNLNFSCNRPRYPLPLFPLSLSASSLACQCQYWGDKAKENAIKKIAVAEAKQRKFINLFKWALRVMTVGVPSGWWCWCWCRGGGYSSVVHSYIHFWLLSGGRVWLINHSMAHW